MFHAFPTLFLQISKIFLSGEKKTEVSFSFTSKLSEHHQTKLGKELVRGYILIPFENVLTSTERNLFHL